MMLNRQLLTAPVVDHHSVDIDGADRVTYLLEQTFRYDYTTPVRELRHRLVVLPPQRHGDQHLRAHRLEVDGALARRMMRCDDGNTVVRIHAERVERSVTFTMAALLERVCVDGPVRLPREALAGPRYLCSTRLTAPDEQLRAMAEGLRDCHDTPTERAARISAAVHSAMNYEYGITTVATTAAEALAGGRGVCQDSAHIMLALCHLLDLPARYVSGHLLGQGGTHAWVEVLVPSNDTAIALPFDPCNGIATSPRYLTVATGRDYDDVPPTSGSYVGEGSGQLTCSRRLAVLDAN
jgi:transglutaminase-like putative cysteine protease